MHSDTPDTTALAPLIEHGLRMVGHYSATDRAAASNRAPSPRTCQRLQTGRAQYRSAGTRNGPNAGALNRPARLLPAAPSPSSDPPTAGTSPSSSPTPVRFGLHHPGRKGQRSAPLRSAIAQVWTIAHGPHEGKVRRVLQGYCRRPDPRRSGSHAVKRSGPVRARTMSPASSPWRIARGAPAADGSRPKRQQNGAPLTARSWVCCFRAPCAGPKRRRSSGPTSRTPPTAAASASPCARRRQTRQASGPTCATSRIRVAQVRGGPGVAPIRFAPVQASGMRSGRTMRQYVDGLNRSASVRARVAQVRMRPRRPQIAGPDHRAQRPRLAGLASELTMRGASTTETMLAGGWKTARMVAHYSAGAAAEAGAVAKYL